MNHLTPQQISRVVYRYIGVSGGYLGDFSYASHAAFYPEYCDLDIDPNEIEGTTRERFIHILKNQSAGNQAKILRGVLQRFPVGASNSPDTRTQLLYDEILAVAHALEGITMIPTPRLETMPDTVQRAIADAELLMARSGAINGVDRMHTALHGYLREICDRAQIAYNPSDSIARLLKLIHTGHPAFQSQGSRAKDVERIVQSFGGILDAINSIRNNASLAHANPELLESAEAYLAINATKSLLQYLEAKLRNASLT